MLFCSVAPLGRVVGRSTRSIKIKNGGTDGRMEGGNRASLAWPSVARTQLRYILPYGCHMPPNTTSSIHPAAPWTPTRAGNLYPYFVRCSLTHSLTLLTHSLSFSIQPFRFSFQPRAGNLYLSSLLAHSHSRTLTLTHTHTHSLTLTHSHSLIHSTLHCVPHYPILPLSSNLTHSPSPLRHSSLQPFSRYLVSPVSQIIPALSTNTPDLFPPSRSRSSSAPPN